MNSPAVKLDAQQASQYLLESLVISRLANETAVDLRSVLACCRELISDGTPLPPLGFIADVFVLFTGDGLAALGQAGRLPAVVDQTLVHRYEDYVLGRFYGDERVQRGRDAISAYAPLDRIRGIAFVLNRILQRIKFAGVQVSPGVLRDLEAKESRILWETRWDMLSEEGLSKILTSQLTTLIDKTRQIGDLLGVEDLVELQRGTAIAEFGQRLALRQVVQAAELLQQGLAKGAIRVPVRSDSAATNIQDEDTYPVGGFSSLSNKGSIESLVRSELVYMDESDRPDVFDVRYVRDELLYYARDDNLFYRRRYNFVFFLAIDLTLARIKDADMPWQRIVLLLGLITAACQQLIASLSREALHIEILFEIGQGEKNLNNELELLETIWRDEIKHGTLEIQPATREQLGEIVATRTRNSVVECFSFSWKPMPEVVELETQGAVALAAPVPSLIKKGVPVEICGGEGLTVWQELLRCVLDSGDSSAGRR